MLKNRLLYAPDDKAGGGANDKTADNKPANGEGEKPKDTPPTFEGWLDGQPDDVKALYAAHTEGLRNTVKATRDERDDMAKQIKALGKTLEEGSAAKKTVDEVSAKLDAANQRADFFEAAAKPAVGLLDVTAAWLIVQANSSDFIDGRGNVRFDALKEKHPVLFGKPTIPSAHAGAGRSDNNNNLSPKSMDNFIRAAAGKD